MAKNQKEWFKNEKTNLGGAKIPTKLWLKFREVFYKQGVRRDTALTNAIQEYVSKHS